MRERRLKNEINVVPYIDVMLVLLVIFMVTAPMMTTASIDVPSVGKAAQAPSLEALQVNIRADQTLSLTSPGKAERRDLSKSELSQAILDAQRRNPEQPVLIVGDKNVKYEAVLGVMDELQRQHGSSVSGCSSNQPASKLLAETHQGPPDSPAARRDHQHSGVNPRRAAHILLVGALFLGVQWKSHAPSAVQVELGALRLPWSRPPNRHASRPRNRT